MPFEIDDSYSKPEKPPATRDSAPPVPTSKRRQSSIPSRCRIVSKFLTIALLIVGAWYALSLNKIGKMPEVREISSALNQSPIQTRSPRNPFFFEYRGNSYGVTPLAEYELWGVVVSHNNIHGIGDMYHDGSSVDFRDLCVIWGGNAFSSTVHGLTYWSEPWTCFVKFKSQQEADAFEPTELSNNHIIGSDEQVRQAVMEAHIGDQIHLKGMLVEYFPRLDPEMKRRSSLTREDQGNGACEVVFAEEFKVIKAAQSGWYRSYHGSKLLLIALVILKVISFVLFPYLEYRSI